MDPVPDPTFPEKFLICCRKSNSGLLGWKSALALRDDLIGGAKSACRQQESNLKSSSCLDTGNSTHETRLVVSHANHYSTVAVINYVLVWRLSCILSYTKSCLRFSNFVAYHEIRENNVMF